MNVGAVAMNQVVESLAKMGRQIQQGEKGS